MDDALRQLRLRRFSQSPSPWTGEETQEASENQVEEANEGANNEAANEGAAVSPIEPADGPIPSFDDGSELEGPSVEEEARVEAINEKQKALAGEAAGQIERALEQIADIAAEQIRQMLGQVANAATRQTGVVLERLAEDATGRTMRVMESLSLEAISQVRQAMSKLAEEQIAPPLSASVSDLSGEVRRIGRELFKATRAAERNQDLFDSAVSEIQRLTSRIEQVPAQLHGSESITEVKAALCREMLGLADAVEASLNAARETLERLQEIDEPEETPEEIEDRDASESFAEISEEPSDQPFWRDYLHDKLQQWANRFAPPRSSASSPPPAPTESLTESMDESQERLDEAMTVMSQWLDGQQLIYERLQTVMRNAGVRLIETEGRTFDPTRHRAISVETRDDLPAGAIIGEERKGYTLDGRILRYAEVIVAKNE